jgi:hypothetical protein
LLPVLLSMLVLFEERLLCRGIKQGRKQLYKTASCLYCSRGERI